MAVAGAEVEEGAQAPLGAGPEEPATGPDGWSFGMVLAGIAVAGLVARIVYVLIVRDWPLFPDSQGFHYRALLLADGYGFILPTREVLHIDVTAPDATGPPGWTILLGGATWLGMRSVLWHQIVGCFVGAGTIVMTGLAGRAAFGRRTGLIAAGITAVYANVWIYEREVLSEPLAMLGVATCAWLAYRFLARPTTALVVAIGAVVGALSLVRAEQFALLAFLVLPLVVSRRQASWSRRVAWLALAGATCLLVISPWAIYNTSRFERPVLLSNGLGGTMRAGNCEPTYSGKDLGSYMTTFVPGDPHGCSILGKKFSDDQSVSDSQLREAALDFMGDHLSRVPVVVAARIGRTFNLYRPFQQVHLEGERRTALWVPWLGLFSFWAVAVLAVAGGIAARRRGIRIYPLLAWVFIVILSVSFTIGAVRYRASAEIPIVLLAAYGVHALLERRAARRSAAVIRDFAT